MGFELSDDDPKILPKKKVKLIDEEYERYRVAWTHYYDVLPIIGPKKARDAYITGVDVENMSKFQEARKEAEYAHLPKKK